MTQLRAMYPDTPTRAIAEALGRTPSAVYQRAIAHGIAKSAAYMAGEHSGRLRVMGSGVRFQRGHATWNKGMRGLDIGGVETRFPKGNRSGAALTNLQPIGTEKLTKDGTLIRKISDTGNRRADWRSVHSLLWEERNGAIPAGNIVVLKDRDRRNVTIENCECITRAENMRRNTYHRYPREIARLIQLRGALNRKINRIEERA